MAITAKQTSDNTILIDFDRPVQPLGVTSSMFTIPGQTVTSIVFEVQKALVTVDSLIEETEELWVQYQGDPQIFFATGQAPEEVQPFEVLVSGFGVARATPEVYAVSSTNYRPTLGDFIDAYGMDEAIKITNPSDPKAESPDELKFLRAVEDAEALWNSELAAANAGALLVLNPGKRRTLLAFARYFLDCYCPRKHVVEAYEEAMRNIRAVSGTGQVVLDPYTGIDSDFFYFANTHGSCRSCGPYGVASMYDVYKSL